MKRQHWEKNLFELIRRTATDLPADVEVVLRRSLRAEKKGSHACRAIETILENADLARSNDTPICQDTGTLTFYFSVPVGFDTNALVARTRVAVARATRAGYLRQNTIDSVSGVSCEANIGHASPVFCFKQGARKTVDVRLLMKGGGCENSGRQYSLPDEDLGVHRDIEGVRACVLDAVWRSQLFGCGPCVLGVCVGGDRAMGYTHAKSELLRKLGHGSSDKTLLKLEKQILRDSRKLGIGPSGLGGRASIVGVNIASLSRLPSTFLVTVSFACWALRRRGVMLGPEGGVHIWLY